MKLEIIVAEIGSTTTVVSGFSDLDAAPRLVGQGQGPTTVEAGDVRQGLKLALADLRANLGCDTQWQPACSSAAGGLKMTVHGLVYDMTARAAREAALGAGAVLHQVTAGEISPHDLEKTRQISPNIILLAGGVDYGERNIILDNARKLATLDLPIPLIYAGNVAIQAEIADIFAGTRFLLNTVENVYPRIDELNIEPTRKAIQQAFEEHIIHAPGMSKIREVVDGPIQRFRRSAQRSHITVAGWGLLVFDVGGATTVCIPSPLVRKSMPSSSARAPGKADCGGDRSHVNAANLIDLVGGKIRRHPGQGRH